MGDSRQARSLQHQRSHAVSRLERSLRLVEALLRARRKRVGEPGREAVNPLSTSRKDTDREPADGRHVSTNSEFFLLSRRRFRRMLSASLPGSHSVLQAQTIVVPRRTEAGGRYARRSRQGRGSPINSQEAHNRTCPSATQAGRDPGRLRRSTRASPQPMFIGRSSLTKRLGGSHPRASEYSSHRTGSIDHVALPSSQKSSQTGLPRKTRKRNTVPKMP